MERSLFGFILKYSRKEQLLIVPLVVVGALVPLSVGAALWRDQTSSSPVDGPRGQMLRPRPIPLHEVIGPTLCGFRADTRKTAQRLDQ